MRRPNLKLSMQASKKSLAETVQCLEKFYALAGRYPRSLNELEEEFEIEVPEGKIGIGLRSRGLQYYQKKRSDQTYVLRYDMDYWGSMCKVNGGDWRFID